MKTIVFIGTLKSGSSREAIKAAQELGYFTVLLTDNEKQLVQREEYPDVHMMKYCDLNDINSMKAIIQELQFKAFVISAIVSFVDSHVHTACLLGDIFGVNNFTTSAIYNMENKLISRQKLQNTDYIPKYITLDSSKEYDEKFIEKYLPSIMKSPNSTGSKDVYKITDYNEFINKLKRLSNKNDNQTILLEEYLAGPQYLVEVLVIRGYIYIIAVVEQEVSYINQHFIVTGYYLMINPNNLFYQQLRKAVTDIVYLHGLKNGSCHLEMRNIDGKWKLIEINPRISGGGMNQLIMASYGINYAKEILKLALNRIPDIKPKYKKHNYIQYITAEAEGVVEKVIGKTRAKNKKGVVKVYVKPRKGNVLSLPKSMGHRYAYVLATGNSKEEAKDFAKDAINEITFIVTDK